MPGSPSCNCFMIVLFFLRGTFSVSPGILKKKRWRCPIYTKQPGQSRLGYVVSLSGPVICWYFFIFAARKKLHYGNYSFGTIGKKGNRF